MLRLLNRLRRSRPVYRSMIGPFLCTESWQSASLGRAVNQHVSKFSNVQQDFLDFYQLQAKTYPSHNIENPKGTGKDQCQAFAGS